jgi:hypothetical protein
MNDDHTLMEVDTLHSLYEHCLQAFVNNEAEELRRINALGMEQEKLDEIQANILLDNNTLGINFINAVFNTIELYDLVEAQKRLISGLNIPARPEDLPKTTDILKSRPRYFKKLLNDYVADLDITSVTLYPTEGQETIRKSMKSRYTVNKDDEKIPAEVRHLLHWNNKDITRPSPSLQLSGVLA